MDYNLDMFFEMDWKGDIQPFVIFLNISRVTIAKIYEFSKFKGKPTLKQILRFHSEIEFIMKSIVSLPDKELQKRIDDLINNKLINIGNVVYIGRNMQAKVMPVPNNKIDELWVDFVILFLGRNWSRELGRCAHCRMWFKKARKDQVYCKKACKASANYYRNRKGN